MQNFFSEYGFSKKVMSDAGGNFISAKFKTFCKTLNIEQVVSSSFNHQTNGQVETLITFIKLTLKNALTLNQTLI